MIWSMTGFARAESRKKKAGWTVEIRSLNHRYLELSLKLPPSLYPLEDRFRELCQSRIRRGKVTVTVMETEESELENVALDRDVLRFYLSAIRRVQREFRLKGELSVSDILTLPRIFSVEKKAADPNRLWKSLKGLAESALEKLERSRRREGAVLARDLLARIGRIEKQVLRIEGRAKALPQEYYERVRERIRALFQPGAGDEERAWREAALLAERADATEEVVRLRSHLALFREKLRGAGEVGKELDFILQEMNRETNTLGAKGQDFDISKETVSIKAELEKIREQVQNIE